MPKLGGDDLVEIIFEKESTRTWSQKEGKMSAVRQHMLNSNNYRIRSVKVVGFAYSSVSFVGNAVGLVVGNAVGLAVGIAVGLVVGNAVGLVVGNAGGLVVSNAV